MRLASLLLVFCVASHCQAQWLDPYYHYATAEKETTEANHVSLGASAAYLLGDVLDEIDMALGRAILDDVPMATVASWNTRRNDAESGIVDLMALYGGMYVVVKAEADSDYDNEYYSSAMLRYQDIQDPLQSDCNIWLGGYGTDLVNLLQEIKQ